jgi:hypothetical protein
VCASDFVTSGFAVLFALPVLAYQPVCILIHCDRQEADAIPVERKRRAEGEIQTSDRFKRTRRAVGPPGPRGQSQSQTQVTPDESDCRTFAGNARLPRLSSEWGHKDARVVRETAIRTAEGRKRRIRRIKRLERELRARTRDQIIRNPIHYADSMDGEIAFRPVPVGQNYDEAVFTTSRVAAGLSHSRFAE